MVKPYRGCYYFFDELRTGTRTEIKRRWTPQGYRPLIRIKLGYEFTYLYAALAPKSGRLIALLLPDMTADSFMLFLKYFEQQVDNLHKGRKTLLIVDQASAHQHRGAKNSKVVLKYLPVACPERNCVERFFEELRKPLSNHILKNINEVERLICRVLKKWYQQPQLLIKLCLYPYMLDDKPK